jgi:hypothetical protein
MAFQYAIPLVAILVAVLLREASISLKDLALMAVFGLIVAAHSLFYPDTSIYNPGLGLLTYSSALILTLRFHKPARVFSVVIVTVTVLSILEAAIGAVQLLSNTGTLIFSSTSAGDAVTGSLANNTRVYYMKMFLQSMLLFYVWKDGYRPFENRKRLGGYMLLIGATSALIGSIFTGSVAVLALGMGAIVLWHLGEAIFRLVTTKRVSLSDLAAVTAFFAAGLVLFIFTQPGNVGRLNRFVTGETPEILPDRVPVDGSAGMQEDDLETVTPAPPVLVRGVAGPVVLGSQKIGVFLESVEQVLFANPRNALIGVGLGRYSSRAAMMLTGGYLMPHNPEGRPDWMPVSRTELTDHYIYNRWLMRNQIYPNPTSSLHDPYSTVQSVVVEFGLLGTLAVVGYFVWVLRTIAGNAARSAVGYLVLLGSRLPPLYFALAISSFYELWLEWPQVMGLIYLLSSLGLSNRAANSESMGKAVPTNCIVE